VAETPSAIPALDELRSPVLHRSIRPLELIALDGNARRLLEKLADPSGVIALAALAQRVVLANIAGAVPWLLLGQEHRIVCFGMTFDDAETQPSCSQLSKISQISGSGCRNTLVSCLIQNRCGTFNCRFQMNKQSDLHSYLRLFAENKAFLFDRPASGEQARSPCEVVQLHTRPQTGNAAQQRQPMRCLEGRAK
jgi:hypothetical protein